MAKHSFEMPEMLDRRIEAYIDTDFYGNKSLEIPQLGISMRFSNSGYDQMTWEQIVTKIESRISQLREMTKREIQEKVKESFEPDLKVEVSTVSGGYFKDIAKDAQILAEVVDGPTS